MDITERKEAEGASESENDSTLCSRNMLDVLRYCQMLFEHERPSDLLPGSERAFETLTGLKNVVGKKVSQVIPGMPESDPELLASMGG